MAMSTGGGEGVEEKPMSDINTTPLVDVMLVLLIVFLIAIPVTLQTVKMDLPVVKYEPVKAKRENILLSVTTTDVAGREPGSEGFEGAYPGGECRIYINTTPISSDELEVRARKHFEDQVELLGGMDALIAGDAKQEDLPEAHIRGDINTPYRCIGGAIFNMQIAGFMRIGFVSSPMELLSSAR
jgi:biopolymer transport protein ExbD